MKVVRAKLVVIGPHNVGKTSVVDRYESKVFTPHSSCTVGASFSHIQVVADNCKVKIQVWDTAGQERFKAMAPLYYRGANGAILMFDLTNPESLSDLKDWSRELLSLFDPNNLVLAVAGNKCDRKDERRVREKDGRDFAKKIDAEYFETSALDNTGVSEVFQYFGTELGKRLQHQQQEKDENFPLNGDIDVGANVSTKNKKPSSGCCR